jgi:hypothetical protein
MDSNMENTKTLEEAIVEILDIKNEVEKLTRLVDLCRGYKNPFDTQTENKEFESYQLCKKGITSQRGKIKRLIKDYYYKQGDDSFV